MGLGTGLGWDHKGPAVAGPEEEKMSKNQEARDQFIHNVCASYVDYCDDLGQAKVGPERQAKKQTAAIRLAEAIGIYIDNLSAQEAA